MANINSFENFEFSIRAINCLRSAGFQTMNDLLSWLESNKIENLVKFRNFGYKSMQEVKEVLIEQGFINSIS